MSATAAERPRTRPRRKVSPRLVGMALAALVVLAMALDTTYKDPDEPITTGGRAAFEPDRYGRETYPKAVATIEQEAQPLPKLAAALREDPDAAGEQFGHRAGNSPYAFPVRGEGVAGKPKDGVLPVKVKGVPKDTTVSLQIGPALAGTAVRDAVGFISFGQFVNQVEYADAATALNTQVKEQVLKDLDATSLEGKRIRFLGAFAYLAPTAMTITPVQLQPAS
jgi:predicted lipoprotein